MDASRVFPAWWVIPLVILGAGVLRLPAMGQALWLDEGLTIALTHWSVADMFFVPTDPTPFLYFSLHKALFAPDAPAWMHRLVALGFGLLGIWLMALIGRRSLGPAGGALCAALLAVAQLHVQYSTEARAYSLLLAASMAMSLGLLGYADAGGRAARRRWLALYTGAAVVGFYSHVMAVFWIAATGPAILFLVFRDWRARRAEGLVAAGLMAGLLLPGLYRLGLQLIYGHSFGWLENPDLAGFLTGVAEAFLPAGLWTGLPPRAATAVMLGLTLVLALLIAVAGARAVRRLAQDAPAALYLIAVSLALVPGLWAFGLVKPVFVPRNILICLPGFLLLVAALLLALPQPWMRRGIAVTVALGIVSVLQAALLAPLPNWPQAAAALRQAATADDIIIVNNVFYHPALRHAAGPAPGDAAAPPVLYLTGTGELRRIEDGLGQDPDWSRTFFEAGMRAPVLTWFRPDNRLQPLRATPGLEGGAVRPPVVPPAGIAGRRVFEVIGGSRQDWPERLDGNLAPGPRTLLWSAPRSATRIETFRLEPMPLAEGTPTR